MTEQQVERYQQEYGPALEILMGALIHMVKKRDTDAITWLISSFSQAVVLAGKSVREGDLMN